MPAMACINGKAAMYATLLIIASHLALHTEARHGKPYTPFRVFQEQDPVLRSASKASSAPAATKTASSPSRAGTQVAKTRPTRIAVVGAGLAGLTAAYRLSGASNIDVSVYEGSSRIGGRCFTGTFPNGQVYEKGGELIDTWHEDIRDLAKELRISLDDHAADEPYKERYYVRDYSNGATPANAPYVAYTYQEASYDFYERRNAQGKSIYDLVTADAENTYPTNYVSGYDQPWPLQYANATLAREVDAMNVVQYLNRVTAHLAPNEPDGRKSKFAQLMRMAYTEEFGAEPETQSAFNVIYLLGYGSKPPGPFQIFGISDERFHTHDGNSKIVYGLAQKIQDAGFPISLNMRLTKVKRLTGQPGKPYELTFKDENGNTVVPAPFDRIVLAIPFATMRQSFGANGQVLFNGWTVDVSEAGFSDLKRYTINNIRMSAESKFNVQFETRFWRLPSIASDGATYCTSDPYNTALPETCYQNTWDVTRGQDGSTGILVCYTGGDYTLAHMKISDDLSTNQANQYLTTETNYFLDRLENVLPGAKANFTFQYASSVKGPARISNVNAFAWHESPWQRGGFVSWRPGDYVSGTATLLPGGASQPDPNTNSPLGAMVSFAGSEGLAEPRSEFDPANRNCHFAGEHTQYETQGFLDGAVQSGNRVYREIIAAGANNGIPVPTTETGPAPSSSAGISVQVAVGAAVAGCIAAVLLAAAFFVVRRRRVLNASQNAVSGTELVSVTSADSVLRIQTAATSEHQHLQGVSDVYANTVSRQES